MRKCLFLLLALVLVSCDKDELSDDVYYTSIVGDWIVTENTDENFRLERYIFSDSMPGSGDDVMYVDGRKISGAYFIRRLRQDSLYLATSDKLYLYKIYIFLNKMTWKDAAENTIKLERQ